MDTVCEALMLESIEEDEYIDDPINTDSIHYIIDKDIDDDVESCNDGIFNTCSISDAMNSVYDKIVEDLENEFDNTIPSFAVNDEEVDKVLSECCDGDDDIWDENHNDKYIVHSSEEEFESSIWDENIDKNFESYDNGSYNQGYDSIFSAD